VAAPATKRETRSLDGIVLLDKPEGFTSNQVLQKTKRLYRAKKAGHTGTLDPMATGMLPICFGSATRVSGLMLESSKRYRVAAVFGVATDTGDATGSETDVRDGPAVSIRDIESRVAQMIGPMSQIPPMYSAVKHEGKRLYALAREGKEVEREPRRIEIHEIEIENFAWPRLSLTVHCSKGTYVRTLVTDLAQALGTVAHVGELRRLSVGPFLESQMVRLDRLEEASDGGLDCLDTWLLGIDAALMDRPSFTVSGEQRQALRNGRTVTVSSDGVEGEHRLYGPEGEFFGTGELTVSGTLMPRRIFHR
jgi:tRNA pseudouridine55 synthase